MRGASAIQELLEEFSGRSIRVLLVWEPVLWSDIGRPRTSVLSLAHDPRVTQFWDPDLVLSDFMVEAALQDPSLLAPGDSLDPDTIVWDLVAVFPPGPGLTPLPRPDFYGGPVVDAIGEVRSALASTGGGP